MGCVGFRDDKGHSDRYRDMKVINILADGTVIKDISTVAVPKDNRIYDVCEQIMKERYEKDN